LRCIALLITTVAVHQQHEVVDVEDLAAVEVEVVVEIEEAEVHVVVEVCDEMLSIVVRC
jgi:hypothetical protein